MNEAIDRGAEIGMGDGPPATPQSPIFAPAPAPDQVSPPGSALARQVFEEARRQQQADQARIEQLQLYRDDVRHFSIARKVLYGVCGFGAGIALSFGITRLWRNNA